LTHDLGTAALAERLRRLADLVPAPPATPPAAPQELAREVARTETPSETARSALVARPATVRLPWEDGLVDWFEAVPRVLDWSYFARPLGDFSAPGESAPGESALGQAALAEPISTGDQRSLYYLQAMAPLTAAAGDLALVSASAMAGQRALVPEWLDAGLLSTDRLANTFVVEDLGELDPSLAGDTALALWHALRRGDAVPLTPLADWLTGARHALSAAELGELIGGRCYTSPMRGAVHERLADLSIAMAVRHSAVDFPGRTAFYPTGSVPSDVRELLPVGRLAWRVSEVRSAVRELLRTCARVYLKAEGIGGATVLTVRPGQPADGSIEQLVAGQRLSMAIGCGRPPATGDELELPIEVACDVTGDAPVISHFTVQVRITDVPDGPEVTFLTAVAKYADGSFSHGSLDGAGRRLIAEHAGELARVALLARPPGCELLSLEGFLLGPESGARIRLVEANLRLAGASQLALVAHRVAAARGLRRPARHWVGNLSVPASEPSSALVRRLQRVVGSDRTVLVVGRRHAGEAKVLVVGEADDAAELGRRIVAHAGNNSQAQAAGATKPRTWS
jgi:hypothetical protein